MKNRIVYMMLAMALSATTLAWAGDTAGPGASCSPDCRPCPEPCATTCPPCE